jgi:hypothetical protein
MSLECFEFPLDTKGQDVRNRDQAGTRVVKSCGISQIRLKRIPGEVINARKTSGTGAALASRVDERID